VALWSLGCFPHSTYASADREAAIAMVNELHLSNNLPQLVASAATKTQTFAQFLAKVGPVQGAQIFKSHMDSVLIKYQGQWNTNLAMAYAEHFTAKEMISLTKEKKASPYASALVERQHDVGLSMQRLSTDLLIKITSEVVAGAYNEAMATK
jgi:hypothetical protein